MSNEGHLDMNSLWPLKNKKGLNLDSAAELSMLCDILLSTYIELLIGGVV